MSTWKVIFVISNWYIISRKTGTRTFATGTADDLKGGHRPCDDSIKISSTGDFLSRRIEPKHRIQRVGNTLRIGCQRINLRKLYAAGRKHRCLTLLVSKKNQARIEALKPGQVVKGAYFRN